MQNLTIGLIVAVFFAVAACGSSGGSLTAEEKTWCFDNSDLVDDQATESGLLDFVDAYYDSEGDGLAADGQPELTDRNIEVSEELRARNAEDADALFDDLFTRYLDHPDGEQACAAAFAANA